MGVKPMPSSVPPPVPKPQFDGILDLFGSTSNKKLKVSFYVEDLENKRIWGDEFISELGNLDEETLKGLMEIIRTFGPVTQNYKRDPKEEIESLKKEYEARITELVTEMAQNPWDKDRISIDHRDWEVYNSCSICQLRRKFSWRNK